MTAVESLTCPTCGAPLTISGNETSVTCQFCGNVVRVASAKPAQPLPPPPAPRIIVQPQIYVPQSRPSPRTYSYGRRGWCAYSLVVLLIAGVITGGTFIIEMAYGGNPSAFLDALLGHGGTVLATFGGKGTGAGFWDGPVVTLGSERPKNMDPSFSADCRRIVFVAK